MRSTTNIDIPGDYNHRSNENAQVMENDMCTTSNINGEIISPLEMKEINSGKIRSSEANDELKSKNVLSQFRQPVQSQRSQGRTNRHKLKSSREKPIERKNNRDKRRRISRPRLRLIPGPCWSPCRRIRVVHDARGQPPPNSHESETACDCGSAAPRRRP